MFLLCMDSSAAASVAVVDTAAGSARVVAQWETQDTRSHAEVITPAVSAVLDRAGMVGGQLDGILVGTGPGPFTGLRAGLVTARTLGFAWGLPVYGMCSLAAIAHDVASLPSASRPPEFVVATDARRKEVYWATYRIDDAGAAALLHGPEVGEPETVPPLPAFGRGAGLYADRIPGARTEPVPGHTQVPGSAQGGSPGEWQPRAGSLGLAGAVVVRVGGRLSTDTTPLYLRESDAKVPGPRKRATA